MVDGLQKLLNKYVQTLHLLVAIGTCGPRQWKTLPLVYLCSLMLLLFRLLPFVCVEYLPACHMNEASLHGPRVLLLT